MRLQLRTFTVTCAAALALGIPALSYTQDNPAENEALNRADPSLQLCIDPEEIRRIDVQDDQTIDFTMRGQAIFRNSLPRACRGLYLAGGFAFQPTRGMICQGTRIEVTVPGSMRRRPVLCRLGSFARLESEAQPQQ